MRPAALGFKNVLVRYDLFNCEFECIVGPKENVGKYVAFQHDDVENAAAYEVTDQRGKYYCRRGYAPIIWMPRIPRTPRDLDTLVHEVGHVVIDLLEYIGSPINPEASELFCYAHGYAVRKILEGLRGR